MECRDRRVFNNLSDSYGGSPFPPLRERYDRLSKVTIDASSIIYMLKAGFLGLLGSTISLRSVPEVIEEVGWPELPVIAVPTASPKPAATTNDDLLLLLAQEEGIPVVSEDRAILMAAEGAGLEYYNALMMLAFLLYRGRMEEHWFREAYERLLEVAHYGGTVLRRYEEHLRELGLPMPGRE